MIFKAIKVIKSHQIGDQMLRFSNLMFDIHRKKGLRWEVEKVIGLSMVNKNFGTKMGEIKNQVGININ